MKTKPKTVPELRFPAFKDSWKLWLLNEFATRGSGHTPSKSHPEYYGGDIDWISLADSNRLDNGYIDKTKTKITNAGLRHSSAVLHPAGTVILSRDAGVGKSAVMKHSMAVSQHFMVWRASGGISVDWFIYYWLQIMKPEFERIAIGSTIKTIGLPYFKKLKISAPSLTAQRKIAEFLTAVDGRIGQLSQKKALLEDYKKGVMQQLFTQALRFKDDHGNDFPKWEEKTLGAIAKLYQPKTITQADLTRKRFTVYGANGIIGKYHSFNHEKPQVTVTCRGSTCGVIGFTEANSWITGNAMVVNLDAHPNSTKSFVYHALSATDLRYLITGSGQPQITGNLKEHNIGFPSLPEQTKIADFLTALDRKIESAAQQIRHTQAFKKGLLQQMFV